MFSIYVTAIVVLWVGIRLWNHQSRELMQDFRILFLAIFGIVRAVGKVLTAIVAKAGQLLYSRRRVQARNF